jgi:SulP family sulfate permease
MSLAAFGRQISAGVFVGLSAVIYSLSYGALLFSGPLASLVGFGITIALITATIGALFGWRSQEKSFIAGPDSNTTSVLASMLAVIGAAGGIAQQSDAPLLHVAMAAILLTSILSAAAFYAVAKANLADLVRYIPFAVMAGFLASTGWLMSSGALNIIAGTPLTLAGAENLLNDPLRPELGMGLLVAGALFALAPRISGALLIPAVMLVATLGVNIYLASGFCQTGQCHPATWLFSGIAKLPWLAPWNLELRLSDLQPLVANLPGMLVVSFVGLLTILLSIASLELSLQKECDLNKVLKDHSLAAVMSAALGGFIPLISIGRTMLNRTAGGGALSGAIAAAICLATLLGAGQVIAYVPKAALGGLVLYLGLGMLKQWLWDHRRTTTPVAFGQIVLILLLVANFGFLVGFSAGLLISCVVFVINYSRTPLADLVTNLSLFGSSVVRPEHEAECLRSNGEKTLLYRLSGYVFFGSASKIDAVFQTMKAEGEQAIDGIIIDFTNISGIDSSAISVFQRIFRRYRGRPTQFYLVYASTNAARLRLMTADAGDRERIHLLPSLDHALEMAEERILEKFSARGMDTSSLAFLENTTERETFAQHCELRQVKKGALLCAEGEYTDAIYFVESGSLEVIKGGVGPTQLRLAKLRKGAMVGELAFYTGEARSAAIAAAVDSSVYVLNKSALARLREAHPALALRFDQMVIRKISLALTRSNNLISMYR